MLFVQFQIQDSLIFRMAHMLIVCLLLFVHLRLLVLVLVDLRSLLLKYLYLLHIIEELVELKLVVDQKLD